LGGLGAKPKPKATERDNDDDKVPSVVASDGVEDHTPMGTKRPGAKSGSKNIKNKEL
jgi:hypothetical protein